MKLVYSFIAVSFFFAVSARAQGVHTTDFRKIPNITAETFEQKKQCSFAFCQGERPDSITKTNGIYTFFYKKYTATVTNITESDYENYRLVADKKQERDRAQAELLAPKKE